MNTQYKKIISIAIKHAYYETGMPKGVSLVADPDTDQLFQQLNSIWRLRENIAEWYVPADFSINDYVIANPGVILKFDLKIADPLFLNFTDLPLDANKMMVFTNSEIENDELTAIISDNSTGKTPSVALELSLDEGSGEAESYEFSMSLQARSVAWRYYIINSSQMEAKLSLSGTGSELFQDAGEKTLINGSKAQLFDSSPHLIPFKEQPDHKMMLNVYSSGNNSNIPLPIPAPGMLKLEKGGSETELYVETYVYL